jgi:hypothetical protein
LGLLLIHDSCWEDAEITRKKFKMNFRIGAKRARMYDSMIFDVESSISENGTVYFFICYSKIVNDNLDIVYAGG